MLASSNAGLDIDRGLRTAPLKPKGGLNGPPAHASNSYWMRLYLAGLGRISSFSNSFTTSSTSPLMTWCAELGSKVSLVPVQMSVLSVGVTA